MICKPCREAGDTSRLIETEEPLGISPTTRNDLIVMHALCNIPGGGCCCQHKVPKVGPLWTKQDC